MGGRSIVWENGERVENGGCAKANIRTARESWRAFFGDFIFFVKLIFFSNLFFKFDLFLYFFRCLI